MGFHKLCKWEDMGPVKGGEEYHLLFRGYQSAYSRSEVVRTRWKGNFPVECRIWEEFPYIDVTDVTIETWSDVVTLTDVAIHPPTPPNS